MADEFIIFTGTANSRLAVNVAREVGVQLGARAVERFPDGEISVQLDEPVRGREVFIVQPTAPPVNDHLVELLAFADACRGRRRPDVTAVVPYFGYSRSDKRHGRREPIMASLVATLLQAAGIDHVITLDLHAAQIEGFFRIPVNSLTATVTLCRLWRQAAARNGSRLAGCRAGADGDDVRSCSNFGRRPAQGALQRDGNRDHPCRRRRARSGVPHRRRHDLDRRHDPQECRGVARRGRRDEMVVAATHALFVDGAKEFEKGWHNRRLRH